jgi:hypothetical protein
VILRVVALLAVAIVVTCACGQQKIERPLDGAPVGSAAKPVSESPTSGPPPTLIPVGSAPADASPATVASPSPLPPPSPTPEAGFVIVATDGAGANMRAAPSTSAPVITTLREGTAVAVLGEPVNAEGRAWRHIQAGNQQGWVVAVVVRAR